MKNLIPLFLFALLFAACGGGATQNEDKTKADEPQGDNPAEITVTPAEPAVSYPDAEILSMTYQDSMFKFKLAEGDYQLGIQTPDAPERGCANSAKGQHIHLIIDKQPYSAQYTAEFPYGIEDGEHYLLAFLSRSYHESIKTPKAHVAQKVMVKDDAIDPTKSEVIAEPTIFYSRPKGTYTGKPNTEKVLLDFFVLNAPVGKDAYQIKADINGQEFMLDAWAPYFIEGLPMGETTVTLTLLDAEGKAVDHPLNPVSRTITLEEDPAEQAVEQ